LFISDGIVHPSLLARFWLRRALSSPPVPGATDVPRYGFHRVASLEALPRVWRLDSFPAIVLYVHHRTLSPSALEHLERFLQAGGGLLALHSASASFKEEPRYHDILGGRFVGHGPVEAFVVQPAVAQDEVFGEVPEFSVRDELYRHEYNAANRIHFYTPVDGEREPMVWTRRRGQGRVCYCALGHTASVMRHPRVHQILQRGLAWVSEEEVA
jgi:type 1 glutamine amidotransferase